MAKYFLFLFSQFSNSASCIVISKEVQEAIHFNHPVVALESTIITHGMPYPDNLETAVAVESIIKEEVSIV